MIYKNVYIYYWVAVILKKYLIFLILILIFSGAVSAQDLNQTNQVGMDDVNKMNMDVFPV